MFKNKIFTNASWIIMGKIGQSVCSFIVTMLTARCLGPSNYGLISYAASLANFAIPIAQLGLTNIQVQELVAHEEEEGKILGTSIILSLISSVASLIGVIVFTMVANPHEPVTTIVCGLYGLLLFFQGSTLMSYWFQARYLSKYSSGASLLAYSLVCAYKVYLLLTGKSIYWFAISNALDYLLLWIFYYYLYKKLHGIPFQFSAVVARRMWSKSKYYIIVNLMMMIFSQTDKVMLKIMVDDAATGFYAAAITCSNLVSFVFVALVDSFRPLIFSSHDQSKEKFEFHMSLLYSIVTYSALGIGTLITLFAPLIVHIIYGTTYNATIPVLRISAWYIVFSYVGMIRNIWILAEGHQKYLMPINGFGALCNIGLNYILIPVIGISGAAVASVLTQFLTNVVVSYMIPATRRSVVLLLRGLHPRYIYDAIRKMRST